jgi:hypothetical protein
MTEKARLEATELAVVSIRQRAMVESGLLIDAYKTLVNSNNLRIYCSRFLGAGGGGFKTGNSQASLALGAS